MTTTSTAIITATSSNSRYCMLAAGTADRYGPLGSPALNTSIMSTLATPNSTRYHLQYARSHCVGASIFV